MQRFMGLAKQNYDVVVFDTPPLLASSDAALLAQGANVVIVVARLKHLTRNQARSAVRRDGGGAHRADRHHRHR